MGLLQNTTINNQTPYRRSGAALTNEKSQFGALRLQTAMNRYVGDLGPDYDTDPTTTIPEPATIMAPGDSYPRGCNIEYSISPAMKPGGGTSNRPMNLACDAADAGMVGVTVVSNLVVSNGTNAVASITGTGDITSASCDLLVEFIAAITGTGSIAGNIEGILDLASDLASAGDLTGALGMLAGLSADFLGDGSVTADIHGTLYMTGDLTTEGSGITPSSVAEAVAALQIDGTFTLAQVLQILAAVAAGKVTGAPGTPAFRDLSDTKDVVSGVVDTNGNRSSATYNP